MIWINRHPLKQLATRQLVFESKPLTITPTLAQVDWSPDLNMKWVDCSTCQMNFSC